MPTTPCPPHRVPLAVQAAEQVDPNAVDESGAEPSPSPPPTQVEVRNISLSILATLASIFMLRWASEVLIPIMLGLLSSYALSPLVDRLQARRVPRAVSAALLVMGLVGGVGSVVYRLSDDAIQLAEQLPIAAQKLRGYVHALSAKPDNTLLAVQQAATQLEQAAEESAHAAPVARGVQRVQLEKPRFDINSHLWRGTMGLLGLLGQVGMVSLIAFFLMASGDRFRRKLVKLAGPTLHKKRITLQALNEVDQHIQRYLLVQLFTSCVVGLATWLCFLFMGVENAAVWGVAAGVLDLIPYIGSVVITGASMLVSFLQFGTLEMAFLVGGVSLLIHFCEAFLLTPWMTSRTNKMNPFAIFIGVLAWGWLWGIWGLLLGVPILVILKAICDRVDDLKPVGEFLAA